MPNDHVDVLIVGAGLSGIGAAHHLQERCPGKSYAILEAREAIGGTWDLFRYPGIRSDSDMHTLGYRFRPWTDDKSIAEGDEDPRLRARHRPRGRDRPPHPLQPPRRQRRLVERGGAAGRSRPSAPTRGRRSTLTCGFLFMNTGYYRYDEGYTPEFPGIDSLRRRGRPPPALARGPRLRRQARGRDRQRRHRDDAGAGDGQGRGQGDDAAALAHLRDLDAGRRRDRQPPAQASCPTASSIRSCAGRT